jgi:hypothetical protein
MKEGKEHYVPPPQATLKVTAGRNGDLFPGHGRSELRPGSGAK